MYTNQLEILLSKLSVATRLGLFSMKGKPDWTTLKVLEMSKYLFIGKNCRLFLTSTKVSEQLHWGSMQLISEGDAVVYKTLTCVSFLRCFLTKMDELFDIISYSGTPRLDLK